MGEIKKILCPVDFSDTSKRALDYAVGLAERLGAELEVVHVYQLPMYTMPDGGVLVGPDMAARIMSQAQSTLDEIVAGHGSRGVEINHYVVEGMPHAEIKRLAEEHGAHLVVMGTHGRSGLSHFLLGSVAERVVRTASVPVLTVPLASGGS